MPLSEAQRQQLLQLAAEQGLDANEVLQVAEGMVDNPDTSSGRTFNGEQPKMFKYLLPFVRVRELRSVWLGLDERILDDDLPCGKWMEKHGGVEVTGGDEPVEE